MTQQERDSIGAALGKAAFFYGIEMDRPKIVMLIDVMIDAWPEASAEKILNAIRAYQADSKNVAFPHPARLAQYVKPSVNDDTLAQEIAGRIPQAIKKFGYMHGNAAKEFIGPHGWAAVESFGGWGHICMEHGVSIDPGQFYAQTRDLIKSKIQIKASGQNVDNLLEHRTNPQLAEPQVKGLVSLLVDKTKMPEGEK